jgi:hypothetical protein
MQSTYAPSSYDDYYCLKPTLLLWLAVVYLSRAILMPLLMGVGHFFNVNGDALQMFRDLWRAEALLPSAIAGAVFIALLRRAPSASRAVRWIWAHGRLLLAVAAVLDFTLSVVPLVRIGELNERTMPSLFAGVVDLYFLLYISVARRVRDTFSDFPPYIEPTKKK